MAATKIKFYDQRMIELMEHALASNWHARQEEFWGSIDFNFRNLSQIRRGLQSFKIYHFANAIKEYNLDANYFFRKNAPMIMSQKELTPKELLREALRKME